MITYSALLLCLISFCLLTSQFLYRTLILVTKCFRNSQFLSLNNTWRYLNLSLFHCYSNALHVVYIDYLINLQARYPDGIALDAVFVHPSVVDMLDAAVGDAIENGHWYCDLSLLYALIS